MMNTITFVVLANRPMVTEKIYSDFLILAISFLLASLIFSANGCSLNKKSLIIINGQ